MLLCKQLLELLCDMALWGWGVLLLKEEIEMNRQIHKTCQSHETLFIEMFILCLYSWFKVCLKQTLNCSPHTLPAISNPIFPHYPVLTSYPRMVYISLYLKPAMLGSSSSSQAVPCAIQLYCLDFCDHLCGNSAALALKWTDTPPSTSWQESCKLIVQS